MIRRAVPLALIPLCVLAGVLASTPWLHSFPSGVVTVPVFGAAVLSALVPVVAVRLGARRLWMSLLVDVIAFVLYTLLVVLHDPVGFASLVKGIYHGPSQILTFALPLVSPRSLLVAPVALTWLAGTLASECLTRRWFTVLPYPGFLISFGLAYAGTVRATSTGANSSHVSESAIAATLLGVLLLLRVAQTWVREDETAESTQADGILPMRGLVVGAITTVVVALVAGLAVQSSAFEQTTTTPQRVPSVNDSRPLSPVDFIASLRPADPKSAGRPAFAVQTDGATLGYFDVANVDLYDGSGWSFARNFRPSGGVLPDDTSQGLKSTGPTVMQEYKIANGPLSGAPWMPSVYRPQKVTGVSVNIDTASGMIVPSNSLTGNETYRVQSRSTLTTFAELTKTAQVANSTTSNASVPPSLLAPLDAIIAGFADQTGTPSSPAIPFLQALQKDLQQSYSLSGSTRTSTPSTPASSPKPTPSATLGARAGSSSYADVVASVLSSDRSGTPEQFATLTALIARRLGVPARVVSGFRVQPDAGKMTLPAGHYEVSTAQAWTWVEVPVLSLGWTVLDASPGTYSNAHVEPSAAASPSPTPTSTPTQNALITKSNNGHAIAPKSQTPDHVGASHRGLVITLVVVFGALLLGLLILLLLRKSLRRRRRQSSPDPRLRALGAWQESIDVLTEAGLPDLTNLTGREIAELTGSQFGPEPQSHAGYIGHTANTAAYSTRLLVSPADADAAWQAERALRQQVGRQLGLRGRVAAWLRYHRTQDVDRTAGPQSWATDALDRRADSGPRRSLRSRLTRSH